MKKARVTPIIIAVALVGALQTAPAAAELETQTVDYKHGDAALEGYLAYDDPISGKRPGVLLLHRYDGMFDFTRQHAEMVAKLATWCSRQIGKCSNPLTCNGLASRMLNPSLTGGR